MSSNEPRPKPGFRRSANDLLGIPEGTAPIYRNMGDELGQVMNHYHERRKAEEAEANKRYLAHVARQLEEFTEVSVQNEIMMTGKPALRTVGEQVIAELKKPVERPVVSMPHHEESESEQDDRPLLSINEIRSHIDQENEDIRDYNGQTGESYPQITDDPVAYAKRKNIRVRY